MRSSADYAHATTLLDAGMNDCAVARVTGIPRSTIRDWRRKPRDATRAAGRRACPECGHPAHKFSALARSSYVYLLGLYLGDGVIDCYARTERLRIALDRAWPGVIAECEEAMRALFPDNRVSSYGCAASSGCATVSVYSQQLPCLFPQHGRGAKHLRNIELAPWQLDLVRQAPERLLRGLIHSDGCRFVNRVRAGGRTYCYARYNFTNSSNEIRAIFTSACDLLGVEWRQMNARNISVAQRASVARLDAFVGPKR
jgi:hypothetical protein